MNTAFVIPGLTKIAFKRKFKEDLLFFLAAVALPSSFFNFVNKTVFVDLRLLYLLIGIIYLVFNFKYLKKLSKITGGKLLLLVVIFVLFEFFYSIVIQRIPWVEVLTIFRTNFFFPIVTLGFLLYAANMDNKRLYRFFYWLILVSFLQGVLYIFSNVTGLDFYANNAKDFQEFQGTAILQNLQSLPDFNMILYTFALTAVFTIPSFKKHWLWFVPFAVTVLSIVRSQMIVYVLILVCLYGFGMLSNLKIGVSKLSKTLFLGSLFSLAILLIFPAHVGRFINKFGFDESETISTAKYTEEGTFKVRLDLIEDAYERTAKNNNLILGNGYTREATKGEYDFVVGGDTLIASVLWTEGYLGLIIRCLPIFFFLLYGIRNIRNRNKQVSLIAIVIIVLILPEIFNLVQTNIFVNYHQVLFIIYLLMMIIYNQKKLRVQIHNQATTSKL